MAWNKIKIFEIGKRAKGSTGFGYRVINNVTGYRDLDYENRARLIDRGSLYLLEEKSAINRCTSQFIAKTVARGYKKADEVLYKMAKRAVKRTLEGMIPEIVDETHFFEELNEKKSEGRNK